MRPLDFLGRIKVKLGLVILLAVVAAFVVNEVGINAGYSRNVRVAVAVVLALIMVQLLARGMTKPLREMAAAAQTVAKGRYGLRVTATSRDEVGELARAFNAMAADLGEVDRQRRELVANVSHELRTPITALRAVLENLVDGVSTPDSTTLGTALAQTERLGRLVAQLLDLSRLDSGARRIEPEEIGLRPLCERALREAVLARDEITARCEVPAGLTVRADPDLLAQVLANLLDNAVRHSPAGGVVVLSAARAGAGVRLRVTDRGPGIPPEDRARAFERFSRLDAGRAADDGGAGLGLAIAKEIVELHGGSIRVEDGTGCRIAVDLPERITMDTPSPASAPSAGGTEHSGASPVAAAASSAGAPSGASPSGAGGDAPRPPGPAVPFRQEPPAPEPGGALDTPGGYGAAPASPGDASRVPTAPEAGGLPAPIPGPPGGSPGHPAGPGGAPGGTSGGPRPFGPVVTPGGYGSRPPQRNWPGAVGGLIGGGFVGLFCGLLAGLVVGIAEPVLGALVGACVTLVGAFIGTVIGATPSGAPPGGRWGTPPVLGVPGPAASGSPVPGSPARGAEGEAPAGPGTPGGGGTPGGAGGSGGHGGPEAGARSGAAGDLGDLGDYVAPPLFPRPDLPGTPRWVPPVCAAVGLLAALALPYGGAGLGLVLVAAAMGTAVLPVAWRRITPWTAAMGVIAYGLVGLTVLRDADWLVALLLPAGFLLAALALSGAGRGWLGVARGGMSVLLGLLPTPWFLAAPLKPAQGVSLRRRLVPALIGGGLTVLLVLLFGGLFASADGVFAEAVKRVFLAQDWVGSLPLRAGVFAAFAAIVASAVLVGLRPVNDPRTPAPRLTVGRGLWVTPLVALNLLFGVFVAMQLTVLFGGSRWVLSAAGLTYAEYARSGFFQLVVVSVFVLAIVAVASGAIRLRGRERWLMAGLLGLLCALTMVILVSALRRLDLYVDAYGHSRLRISVEAAIWWLGAVFALVLVAGATRLLRRGRATWLPRALVTMTGAALLVFGALNPDLRIAETQVAIRGVDRLDQVYLGDLGAEAVPALDRLPEPMRSCVLRDVVETDALDVHDPWNGWNLAREQARELLRRRPVIGGGDCSSPVFRLSPPTPA
ncbi:hypothetical protein GCM10017673_18140 [Streptosporangium violaceochromogenes]|nr:hypothetical protein GCM10017673_18140 [Streptosporangium violaceochromogenes]